MLPAMLHDSRREIISLKISFINRRVANERTFSDDSLDPAMKAGYSMKAIKIQNNFKWNISLPNLDCLTLIWDPQKDDYESNIN